jgi:hypothetical protein
VGQRTVVEVRENLHREVRKLALLNDLRIYELVNGIVEEALKDQESMRVLVRRLKLSLGRG